MADKDTAKQDPEEVAAQNAGEQAPLDDQVDGDADEAVHVPHTVTARKR